MQAAERRAAERGHGLLARLRVKQGVGMPTTPELLKWRGEATHNATKMVMSDSSRCGNTLRKLRTPPRAAGDASRMDCQIHLLKVGGATQTDLGIPLL